jgi:transcription elongation factor Elf1
MSERKHREKPPIKVTMVNDKLRCLRCGNSWDVVDLNPQRKIVACPICAEFNDIQKAINLARGVIEYVSKSGS